VADFKRRGTQSRPAPTPEALFPLLVKAPDGPQHLWAHQADLLRSYVERVDVPDIALELPTGAGKTLVGLLIAEWRRRQFQERVVYLCPTRQLVRQTASRARMYGLTPVVLMGNWKDWPARDKMLFESSAAVAISTYSTIFNSSPKLSPQALVLDDAHSGEGYVSGAWSIQVDRFDDTNLYGALLDVFAAALDDFVVRRCKDDNMDPMYRGYVKVVPPDLMNSIETQLSEVFESHPEGKQRFAFAMLDEHLSACSAYVSWREINIRPYIAPTFALSAFDTAAQRVYMSATLGAGGELERAFGRHEVARLPVPEGWERQGSGRRFFVFPDLCIQTDEVSSFVRKQIALRGKALILCPDGASAKRAEAELIPPGTPVMRKDDIEEDLDRFAQNPNAVLLLSNRYDGIDLPGDTCRLVVLYDLPVGIDLQEKFLLNALGARGVLQERIRTRITQGAGRCTRSPSDFAAVIVCGGKLAGFCSQRDVQNAMHPELRAEVEFGLLNSDTEPRLLESLLDSFFLHDEKWREQAEPELRDARTEYEVTSLPEAAGLVASVASEVSAQESAWAGDWARATTKAQEAHEALAGGGELAPYRALWLHLAAAWAAVTADDQPNYANVARDLVRRARVASRGRLMIPHRLDEDARVPAAPQDEVAEEQLDGVVAYFQEVGLGTRRFEELVVEVQDLVSAQEARKFERGLEALGKLLGFFSERPDGQGAPDTTWRLASGPWIAFEAKSDESATSPLSLETVRQANTHMDWLANALHTKAPSGSSTVVVSPRVDVPPDVASVSQESVYLLTPATIRTIASEVLSVWRTARGLAKGQPNEILRESFREQLVKQDCLSTALFRRLQARPIRPRESRSTS